MLKKVTLYGELAEKYGKSWSLDIESPAEAIRALCANNPGFKQFVGDSVQRGVGYKVIVGGRELDNVAHELRNPTGRQEIKIVPVVGGAKSKFASIIIGIAMIYISIQMGLPPTETQLLAESAGTLEGGAIIGGNFIASGSMASMAMNFGASLVLGGIAQMLAPTPKTPETKESVQNYAFNGATNTTRQGVAIPICYGQLMVGGAVISSGVSPEDYTP
jgi:predicted phage tail protein